MKKFIMAAGALLAFNLGASAATTAITACDPIAGASFAGGNGGPTTFSCPSFNSFAASGAFQLATLFYSGDFTTIGLNPTANQVTLTFNEITNNTFAPDPASIIISNNAGAANPKTCTPPACETSATSAAINVASAIEVEASSARTGGSPTSSVNQSTASVFVQYTYADPTGEIPEPTTFALLGAGLVGVAIMSRRRRA